MELIEVNLEVCKRSYHKIYGNVLVPLSKTETQLFDWESLGRVILRKLNFVDRTFFHPRVLFYIFYVVSSLTILLKQQPGNNNNSKDIPSQETLVLQCFCSQNLYFSTEINLSHFPFSKRQRVKLLQSVQILESF